RSDALLVLPHPLFNTRAAELANHSPVLGVPGIYPFSTYADSGGMMSLGVTNPPDVLLRADHVIQ
ncbi:MAG: hypothetical protein LJE90_08600, partial [Betaproteobacteria bacterium]|nr:hypothetical protein [Betaproteobacteria bacterium]